MGGSTGMSAMEQDLPYLGREKDRHGNWRLYVRRNGKRIRIRAERGTPAFARAYADAVDALSATPSKRAKGEGVRIWPKDTLGWLGIQFFTSKGEGGFLDLA